jgi:hemolysin activation/secretion protein
VLDFAPFCDVGYGWNHFNTHDQTPVLASAGVGLLLHPNSHLNARVYYGYPFHDFHRSSNLQDLGIHFDLVLNIF